MRTIETKVYRYDELSSEAKENARNSLRDRLSGNRIDAEAYAYRNTLKRIEEIFGIKVRDWSVNGYSPTYFRFYFVNLDEDIENKPKFLLRYLNRFVIPCIMLSLMLFRALSTAQSVQAPVMQQLYFG